MRANVFTDPALVKQAGRFAWLSIDTEKAKNAAFLEKFPINAWPTFLVVDPATETVGLRWYGSATVPQLVKLLEDGERAIQASGGDTPEAALARADRLNGERKFREAAEAYREALKRGGRNWERRARAVESLAMALQFARAREDCAHTALQEAPQLPRGPSFANAVATGLTCALGAPPDAQWRAEAIRALRPLVEEALQIPGLLGDDRSGLYDLLVSVAEEEKDQGRAQKIVAEWFRFLESERQRGPNAEARAANDGHRVTAALKLGDPARAIPALQASERELPDDYNPPARLAVLYRELGRYDEALAASDRALAKAYGPRRLGILTARAAIYAKKGDKAGAKRTLEEAVRYAQSLPKEHISPEGVARLRKQAAAMQ